MSELLHLVLISYVSNGLIASIPGETGSASFQRSPRSFSRSVLFPLLNHVVMVIICDTV